VKIAREGLPFVLPLALASMAGWLLVGRGLGLALLAAALFTYWFFRDPERSPPDDDRLVISPADGKVLLPRPGRVSIFMNVFNVHVCRAPLGGTVEEVMHTPGDFLAAYREEASEQNERVALLVRGGSRAIRCTLVAGLIARRIVCRVAQGDQVRGGDRIGLIRFGSRVDVDLPEGAEIRVAPGQKVRAGETALAAMPARAEEGAERASTPTNAVR
jgi:phosphatidylserine decarboxylase